ncbi:spore coat protein U domain-containing protein [Lutibacter sp.]
MVNYIVGFFLITFGVSLATISGHHKSLCSVHFDEFPLGEYDPIVGFKDYVPAVLTVRCSGHKPLNFTIKLLGGNSNSQKFRYMYSPSTKGKLYYNIYINNGCIFGDGTEGTCVLQGTYQPKHHGGVQEIRFTLIGKILPNQDVPVADDYSDTLIFEIDY